MKTQEAADFINNEVAFEPGLSVRARAIPASYNYTYLPYSGMPAELRLDFELLSVDSGSIDPYGKYPEHGSLVPVGASRVLQEYEYKTREQLLYQVIQVITEIRQHDTREFTRYRDAASGAWVAPFHPHRADGEGLWRYGGQPYVTLPEHKEKEAARLWRGTSGTSGCTGG